MLAWTIYISFIGVLVLMLLPKASARRRASSRCCGGRRARCWCSSGFSAVTPGELLTVTRIPWIPSLGIEYHLAADGISLALLLLTGIVGRGGRAVLVEHGAARQRNFSLFIWSSSAACTAYS